MSRILLCFALLALAACGRSAPHAAVGANCDGSVSHSVVWSGATPDTVTARSEGPSCLQAVVTLTVRNAAGDPLWVHAATFYAMDAGGAPPAGAPPITNERMETFLDAWSNVNVSQSGALPEWREGVASLTDSVTTFGYETAFERGPYEALRARDLPMLCFASAVASVSCLVIDPLLGAPMIIVSYGP